MTGLDLAVGEELSRSFEPCLSDQNTGSYYLTLSKFSKHGQ